MAHSKYNNYILGQVKIQKKSNNTIIMYTGTTKNNILKHKKTGRLKINIVNFVSKH